MELCFVLLCKHTVFLCFFYVRTKRGQARHPARSPVPFPSNDTRSLNASLPATQAHSLPSFPRLPMSPAPCRHKAPPLGGQADDRAPLPNKAARPHRTPALFNSSHLRGRALPSTPPPLHPRFWHGNRPPWPGVVCCPHPPGAALLPGRKVLGPTLQPIDKEHASPPIYLPPPPLRVSQTTPL